MIAYVPQDPHLFEGTIEENLRFGRPDAEEEELIEAAKAAYAYEFILGLPDGYLKPSPYLRLFAGETTSDKAIPIH
ncbi:hypothetical protein AYJ08_14435 [Brevibacillus sp. SKDU10]|uniref:hypothetical protein n=1 Tax=Brevibacillus sp. SKDU10 TaxID=1247872 RepID=UPI0007C8E03E|nr:hypothetical protein AYJ08_14435 [Brevibacillus sp. SKDU10]